MPTARDNALNNAPLLEWEVSEWFNHEGLTPEDLQGKVVLIEVFQMLCPGCVNHSIPQAVKIHHKIDDSQLQVIGLHSVFEHHDVMTPEALKVFLSEFGVKFPVAVDKPREGQRIPATMKKYRLEGHRPRSWWIARDVSVRWSSARSMTSCWGCSSAACCLKETKTPRAHAPSAPHRRW
ncbi:TlpA family protein disulfide reductase [uncultured Corynebacterium sp.]|uniref:TlpA family protein disulfide reductase n=1 Tax=uncultured Corynebacterium sp. TaxID=159447 RepID=UPI0025E81E7A|nr:TlpA family protein disulfide reductase [uncultured Corynebacterium sp.]